MRWAIAGRSAAKLDEVAATTGADVPRIVADAASRSDVISLVDQTRLVISTVGPYALYGSLLVEQCARLGVDYCDLTGEPQWMQAMIDRHHDDAVQSGARIIHACGFDSIPSDLGVWFTQQEAKRAYGETCRQISMRVKSIKGGASGGTVASVLNLVEETTRSADLRKVLANPYALAPKDMRTGVRQHSVSRPSSDKVSDSWVAPFVMAAVNTRVVHRTHALLGHPWGTSFLYDEAMIMGDGPKGAAKASLVSGGMGGFMLAAAISPIRKVLSRFVLPKPGEGPSVAQQQNGSFDLRFYGQTNTGKRIVTKVTGDKDPGYGATAKMLGEVAFALLSHDKLAGGFWTPASAFGDELLSPLIQHAGMTFEVLDYAK
jgi:short subunit dehydrogenase-like uncharacterized protein